MSVKGKKERVVKDLYRDFAKENIVRIFAGIGLIFVGAMIFKTALNFGVVGSAEIVGVIIVESMLLIPGLLFLLPFFVRIPKFKKLVQSLNDDGDFLANLEFDVYLNIWHSGDYIVDSSTLQFIKCSDIVWCYGETHRTNGIKDRVRFICKSPEKTVKVLVKHRDERKFPDIYEYVVERNPKCLVGFSNENHRIYKGLKNSRR
jgi:hypothetical protein